MSIINEALKKASGEKTYVSDFSSGPSREISRILNINELQKMAWERRKWVLFSGISGTIVASVAVSAFLFGGNVMMPQNSANIIAPAEEARALSAALIPEKEVLREARPLASPADDFMEYLKLPNLKLSGIMQGRGKPFAVIDGRVLKVGDHIKGASVAGISKSSVVMVYKGQEFVLRLK